jgi:hypothetical protein
MSSRGNPSAIRSVRRSPCPRELDMRRSLKYRRHDYLPNRGRSDLERAGILGASYKGTVTKRAAQRTGRRKSGTCTQIIGLTCGGPARARLRIRGSGSSTARWGSPRRKPGKKWARRPILTKKRTRPQKTWQTAEVGLRTVIRSTFLRFEVGAADPLLRFAGRIHRSRDSMAVVVQSRGRGQE